MQSQGCISCAVVSRFLCLLLIAFMVGSVGICAHKEWTEFVQKVTTEWENSASEAKVQKWRTPSLNLAERKSLLKCCCRDGSVVGQVSHRAVVLFCGALIAFRRPLRSVFPTPPPPGSCKLRMANVLARCPIKCTFQETLQHLSTGQPSDLPVHH